MSGDNVFVQLGSQPAIHGYSGATPLGQLASQTEPAGIVTNILGDPLSATDIFLGLYPGSWGETSSLCIFIGMAILLLSGVGNWRIILSGLTGGFLMAVVAHNWASPLYPVTYLNPLEQLGLGGFLFAITFMATDPVTVCRTPPGSLPQHRLSRGRDARGSAHELFRSPYRLLRGQLQHSQTYAPLDGTQPLILRL